MDETLITALLEQGEGTTVEYKRIPYIFTRADIERDGRCREAAYFEKKKSEILKDILAMANADRDRDSYILIGVQERRAQPAEVVGVDTAAVHDEASIQQFIATHVEKPLIFEYKAVEYRGKIIIVLRIPFEQRSKVPFLSKHTYGVVSEGATYLRRGSHTSVADAESLRTMFAGQDGGAPVIPPQVNILASDRTARQHLDTGFPHTRLPDLRRLPDFDDPRGWLGRTFGGRANSSYWRDFAAFVEIKQNSFWVYFEIFNPSSIHLTECTVQIEVTTTDGVPVPAHNRIPNPPERYRDRQEWLDSREKFLKSQKANSTDWRRRELSSKNLRPGDKSGLSDGLLLYFGEHQTLHIHYRVLAKELRKPAEGLLVITMDNGKDDWTFDRLEALASRDRGELVPRGFGARAPATS